MARKTCGAEEARAHLPELLERAHHGVATVITKRGKAYAALVPIAEMRARGGMRLLDLKGTGAGLWGRAPARTLAKLRDEWE